MTFTPGRPAHNHWVVGEERDTYRRFAKDLMDKEGKGLIEATLDGCGCVYVRS